MSNISVFNYNGTPISFDNGENVMVNATEMAKPFKKLPADWTRQKSSKAFMSSLSAVRGIPITGLVSVNQGGNGEQGTWMHEDVALEFARWLSPEFAIWCNDRIKELLRHGITATDVTIESIIADPESGIRMLKALKEEREERKRLEMENAEKQRMIEVKEETIARQEQEIKEAAPYVTHTKEVLDSKDTLTTNEVANRYGMTGQQLNQKLKNAEVQYKQGGMWMLRVPYCRWKMTGTRTASFTGSDGSQRTNTYMVWNERGRFFIDALVRNGFDAKAAVKYIKGEQAAKGYEPQESDGCPFATQAQPAEA